MTGQARDEEEEDLKKYLQVPFFLFFQSVSKFNRSCLHFCSIAWVCACSKLRLMRVHCCANYACVHRLHLKTSQRCLCWLFGLC